MITLRPYQNDLKQKIYGGWSQGHRNVLAVSPTGSGKTAVKGSIFHEVTNPSVAIAHRQELVSQISNALAKFEVYHRIIAPKAVIEFCIQQHIKNNGRHFYHGNAPVGVAGVDTLIRRGDELVQWCNQVTLWDIDEAHHVLPANKWGKAVDMFPRAYGLGLTATPVRADRKSLGRETGGVFDEMVVGPNMRDLIDAGYLADYRIFGPPSGINWDALHVSKSTGDFTQPSLVKEMERTQIIGDVVDHYLKLAPGKLGITFVVSVEQAGDVAAAFRQKGVPAEAVSAKTPDAVRQSIIDRFARGEIKQMVNVDLFGEGMDVPAVEVVSAARPTLSYGLYIQQFGRALRTARGKTHGIYIDHVGKRHQTRLAGSSDGLGVE
jgi:DNA repair protein RadD